MPPFRNTFRSPVECPSSTAVLRGCPVRGLDFPKILAVFRFRSTTAVLGELPTFGKKITLRRHLTLSYGIYWHPENIGKMLTQIVLVDLRFRVHPREIEDANHIQGPLRDLGLLQRDLAEVQRSRAEELGAAESENFLTWLLTLTPPKPPKP